MSKIVSVAKTIRRNWKKSIVGFSVLAYGVSYGFEKYRTFQMMRAYCEEAKKYGEQLLPNLGKPRHVTVILNPVAHEKKAKSLYEKYAAPLLHLAGLKVSVIQTESEGQARDLMEIMSNTDAVIIAGGNGTLHEAVTGLLGREEYEEIATMDMPIGVIPVGKSNTVAKVLFSKKTSSTFESLAEAAMAVVRESTVLLDVMKIEGHKEKPIFALSSLEVGAFPDLEANLSKYWYFGPLKAKVAYLYNSLKSRVHIDEDVDLEYSSPCQGCSYCYKPHQKRDKQPKRWWSTFLPKATVIPLQGEDYSKVVNKECGVWHTQNISFSNLIVSTPLRNSNEISSSEKSLWINVHPSDLSLKHFVVSGLSYHDEKPTKELEAVTFPVKEVKLAVREEKERTCYIDTEKTEIKNVNLSLLPKRLLVYA